MLRATAPARSDAPASVADGAGLPRRKRDAARRRQSRGQERDARALCEGLSRRAARSAAEHVPGVRIAASRSAHAAHRNVLSGSACCVYGLTFTSHFYGAKRTVGYVPFNSETLVTGKLFEDIREAVFKLADPAQYDAIVVINLCVPTASGVPLRPSAEGDRRRSHHRHRRAGLRRADACRSQGRAGRRRCSSYARKEAEHGPVQAPRGRPIREADRDADRRNVSGRSRRHRRDAGADGSRGGAGRFRRANGVSSTARWTARSSPRSILSTPRASASSSSPAGRSSAPRPVGVEGTAAWLEAIGAGVRSSERTSRRREGQSPAGDQGRARANADPAAASRCPATRAPNCWSRGC